MLLVTFSYKHISILGGGIMEDDAYFYAQIGYNLGVNKISSFDGINITSGYHLLWGWLLGILSFLVSLFSSNKDIHLFFMFVLYCYITLNMSFYFGKNIIERIILFLVTIFLTMLMETGLLSLLLLIVINTFYVKQSNERIGYLAAFLVPLARIDAVVFLSLPLIYLFYKQESRLTATKLSITVLFGMVTQFALMYISFQHFFSVSSLIKAGSAIRILDIIANNITGYTNRKLLFIGFIIFLAYYLSIKNKNKYHILVVSSALLFLLLHIGFNFGIRDWYYMPTFIVVLFILFQYDLKLKSIVYGLCIMLILRWGYSSVTYRINDSWGEIAWQKEFVDQLQEVVPIESRIYLIDGSGFMGYISERTIINGDGLVNSYDYYYLSSQDNLENYLENMQIDYLITNLKNSGDVIVNYHGLVVNKQDVELLIDIPDHIDGGNFHNWRLFKLKRSHDTE